MFDSLYEDFNTTITSLLEIDNKMIDKIQNILQFKEAKNISKKATRNTKNLIIAFKDSITIPKRKVSSHNKC